MGFLGTGDREAWEITGKEGFLAPRAGFEPATIRLTVECSTAELPRNRAKPKGFVRGFANGLRITNALRLAKQEIGVSCAFRPTADPTGAHRAAMGRRQEPRWIDGKSRDAFTASS